MTMILADWRRKDPDDPLEPCDVHNNCLECPLPQCRYDDEAGYLAWYRQHKLPPSIPMDLYFYDAQAVREIAAREGYSLGTLYIHIRDGRIALRTHKQLMEDARALGLKPKRVCAMIKRGDIEKRPSSSFPPIHLHREYARQLPLAV